MSLEQDQGKLVGRTLGRYRLVEVLGVGGMAEVYRGIEAPLGREVAVKVLPAGLAQDPGYVSRFREEARRVAALNHPNIMPLYGYGEEQGLLYLVMPLLKESLRDRMERAGPLEAGEAVRIVIQIAAGLEAAHELGLVHRDVKPENIMLNAEGRALLTDFGIAREVAVLRDGSAMRTLAATGLPVGTPEYMAPEQLRGAAADERVDVYALGAVLYEALTGQVPYEADTPYEVAARVLTERARPPTYYNDAIWPELEEVVLRALSPEAEMRYPDMRSLAVALRHALTYRGTGPVSGTMVAGEVSVSRVPIPRGLATRRFGDNPLLPKPVDEEAGYVTRHWGDTHAPRRMRKSSVVLVVVAVCVALAVCASGTLLIINTMTSGVGGPHTSTTPGASGAPGSAATATAQAQATIVGQRVSATPTSTVEITPTAAPTATPVLPSITATSPVQMENYKGGCVSADVSDIPPPPGASAETLTNTSPYNVSWSLSNLPAPPNHSGWYYYVNDPNHKNPTTNLTGTLASGVSVTLGFARTSNCLGKSAVITVNVSGGNPTNFTLNY